MLVVTMVCCAELPPGSRYVYYITLYHVLYMWTYMYMYVHVCVCACVCVYIYIYIHIYIYTYIHILRVTMERA